MSGSPWNFGGDLAGADRRRRVRVRRRFGWAKIEASPGRRSRREASQVRSDEPWATRPRSGLDACEAVEWTAPGLTFMGPIELARESSPARHTTSSRWPFACDQLAHRESGRSPLGAAAVGRQRRGERLADRPPADAVALGERPDRQPFVGGFRRICSNRSTLDPSFCDLRLELHWSVGRAPARCRGREPLNC
jgi:hypothetical protein